MQAMHTAALSEHAIELTVRLYALLHLSVLGL